VFKHGVRIEMMTGYKGINKQIPSCW